VPIETFTIMLLTLISLGVTGSIVWNVAKRYPVNGENLLAVLWKDYIDSVHWFLGCRWVLVLLALAAAAEQLSVALTHTVVQGDTRWFRFGLLHPSEWATDLRAHFFGRLFYTYIMAPLWMIRPAVMPIRGSFWVTVLVSIIGLWLFRSYTKRDAVDKELHEGVRSFRKTLIWTTALAIFVVAYTALLIAREEDVLAVLTPTHMAKGGFWIRYFPSLLADTSCGALFMSALLGTYRAHLCRIPRRKASLEAFCHYRPMFIFIMCMMLVMLLFGVLYNYIQELTGSTSEIQRAFFQYVLMGLTHAVHLALLLVPVAVVADSATLKVGIKRSLNAWDTQLGQMVIAVVFFMAVAVVTQSALFLIRLPFGFSWIVMGFINRYVSILLQTSILLGVYRFYLRISERGTDSTNARQPITPMVRH